MPTNRVRDTPPRGITTAAAVRVVVVGGFLGAGKTTAIGALAGELSRRGLRVGVITNDQAAALVDTAIDRHHGLQVAEVAGGCFCCRFEDMLDAIVTLMPSQPAAILCEPVGSCTDLVATVLKPLEAFYPAAFHLAPLTVLADPRRVREVVLGETSGAFPAEVGYIYRKQVEEADWIALSKTDTISAEEATRLCSLLADRYRRPVLRISARAGEGIAAWAESILGTSPSAGHVLSDLDYDRYAAGEAAMGWLNATVRLASPSRFDGHRFLAALLPAVQRECVAAGGEIAHVKAGLDTEGAFARGHLTATDVEPTYHPAEPVWMNDAQLLINARVVLDPEVLERIVRRAVAASAEALGVMADTEAVTSFRPAYPRPQYRMAEPQR